MIIYYRYKEINKSKWDDCIKKSSNGIVYAFSWYLDIVCENWEALVEDDYETVFPLTAMKKYGINYLYQPFFAQQLGIFSINKINKTKIEQFLNKIPVKYKYIDISLNIQNSIDFVSNQFRKKVNITYELELFKPYEEIYQYFSTNTRRNVKKARESGIKIIEGIQPDDWIDLKKKVTKINLKVEHYNTLRKIILYSLSQKTGKILGAFNRKNKLCAAAFFITSHHKSIYLLSASDREIKNKGAMFLLIDHFIKTNSGQNLVLDFEGSNIEGLARFFSSFGATAKEYFRIKQNRLPWFVKFLKK